MSRAFSFNLRVCVPCEFSQKNCAGACACTVDGIDIREHARAGDCPKNYFPDPSTLPPPRPSAPCPPESVPRAQWPRRVKLLARLAILEDRGAGDTFHRLAAKFGGDKVVESKAWVKMFGPCDCGSRRERWNGRYQY